MDFTIVIPSFNEEEYLPLLLHSINSQSIKPKEIIVVDGGSSDHTKKIAEAFSCSLHSVRDGTPAKARNRGVNEANTPIVIMLDDDTILDKKDFLKKTLNIFLKQDYDVAVTYFHNISGNRVLGRLTILGVNFEKILNQFLIRLFNKPIGGSAASLVVKKDPFTKLGGFNEKMYNHEDSDFYIRTVKMGYKFGLIATSIGWSGRRFDKLTLKEFLTLTYFYIAYKISYFSNNKKLTKKFELLHQKAKGKLGGFKD